MAQELYFDQELARKTAEEQVEAVANIIDSVDMSVIENEQNAEDHSDEWYEEYGKITEVVAGSDAPHIPNEILPFWEQNDERLNHMYHNVISEWYGDNSSTGKKLLLAFNTMDKEGI